jgi:acetyl esterase/lipase
MAYDIANDTRLDPRIKSILSVIPEVTPTSYATREDLVGAANSPSATEQIEAAKAFTDLCDTEENSPSKGLTIDVVTFTSSPDGNEINLQVIRPDTVEALPCVYYIHGGGMATMSAFDGMYRGWGKIIASMGVSVVMVDFRNCVRASSAPQIEPFPAGLNDCVSGLRYLVANAAKFNVDPARIVVAGESGGGNLTLATALTLKRDGDLGILKGIYALCPYIAGQWPQDQYPSSTENNGILLNLHSNYGALSYGVEAFNERNPLAWPSFATVEDVTGFPPTVISVNECDPLRDEGVAFYRLLLRAGVSARGRMVLGTMHGTEIFSLACPEISRDTARDLAAFATI